MLMEVYYEHYAENCKGQYWLEEKKLPYMVLIREEEKREELKKLLTQSGFRCVAWNSSGYPGILVNMELRRFGMIHFACKHACVGDRNYSFEEFMGVFLKRRVHRRRTFWIKQ